MLNPRAIASRLRAMPPQLRLFLIGIACLGIAGGIFETTFNNYVSDVHDISADARGFLEFPRELPGFLTAVMAGMLFFLPETMIAAVCAIAVGIGMIGLALWGGQWWLMLGFMILWSCGAHLSMPVRSSLSMLLASDARKGRRLGQVSGTALAAMLFGCACVWIALQYLEAGYTGVLLIGGVAALAASIAFFAMRMPNAHLKRPRFVWHRRYWLFYVLALLFGARKQIFVTFGPWVLIRVFDQEAYVIAKLWIAGSMLGVVLHPLLGRIIDRFGERKVLVTDSLLVLLICCGYGFAHRLESRSAALWVLYACYVADQLLFGVNMARTTYLSRIAVKPEHLAPTLSLGISINHAVSMSLPALGGILWVAHGHSAVFIFAGGVAVLMLIFSSLILPRSDVTRVSCPG